MDIPLIQTIMLNSTKLLGYNTTVIIKHFITFCSGILLGGVINFCIMSCFWFKVRYKDTLGEGILAIKGSYDGKKFMRVARPIGAMEVLDSIIVVVLMNLSKQDEVILKDVTRVRYLFMVAAGLLLIFGMIGFMGALDVFPITKTIPLYILKAPKG